MEPWKTSTSKDTETAKAVMAKVEKTWPNVQNVKDEELSKNSSNLAQECILKPNKNAANVEDKVR